MNPSAPHVPRPRSKFVTVIAVFGMISGCLALFGGGAVAMMQPSLQTVGMAAGGVMAVAAAWGLLKRKNWARLSFIGVQALAIAQAFYRIAVIPRDLSARMTAMGLTAEDVRASVATARSAALVFAVIFTIINGLIIAKLCSPRVREEFEEQD
jgi:hypothetical protein